MHRLLTQILLVIFIIVFAADTHAENAISIIAVGDVMMGSSYPNELLPPDDGAGIFDGIKEDFNKTGQGGIASKREGLRLSA